MRASPPRTFTGHVAPVLSATTTPMPHLSRLLCLPEQLTPHVGDKRPLEHSTLFTDRPAKRLRTSPEHSSEPIDLTLPKVTPPGEVIDLTIDDSDDEMSDEIQYRASPPRIITTPVRYRPPRPPDPLKMLSIANPTKTPSLHSVNAIGMKEPSSDGQHATNPGAPPSPLRSPGPRASRSKSVELWTRGEGPVPRDRFWFHDGSLPDRAAQLGPDNSDLDAEFRDKSSLHAAFSESDGPPFSVSCQIHFRSRLTVAELPPQARIRLKAACRRRSNIPEPLPEAECAHRPPWPKRPVPSGEWTLRRPSRSRFRTRGSTRQSIRPPTQQV